MNAGRRFVVSLHDVTPSAGEEIARILKELQPRVGRAISAAVIPAPFAQNRGAGLAAQVLGQCREIALHGCSHQGPEAFHPLWLLTGDCLEFTGLRSSEARARLQRGQSFGEVALVDLTQQPPDLTIQSALRRQSFPEKPKNACANASKPRSRNPPLCLSNPVVRISSLVRLRSVRPPGPSRS